MKKMISMFLAAIMVLSLAGCSMFSNGSSADQSGKGDIKISDSYTHKDPEGLEYATRYAFCTAPDDPYITEGFQEEYGIDMVKQYMILYADKDDKALCQFDYYVAKDAENAEKTMEVLGDDLFTVEGDVCVGYYDEEIVQMIIDMNMQYGSLSENTASAYAQSEKDFYMFIDVQ